VKTNIVTVVSNAPGGWLPLIFSTLASGTVGGFITTFATQARDRRAARAQVRARVTEAERAAYLPGLQHADLVKALDDLEDAAFVAGVPSHVIELYRDARMAAWVVRVTTPPGDHAEDSPKVVSGRVAHQAAIMLIRILWHPWLTIPIHRWRIGRLRRVLDGGVPHSSVERAGRNRLRRWEREMLRREKQTRRRPPEG
jgi:hypothetical protein